MRIAADGTQLACSEPAQTSSGAVAPSAGTSVGLRTGRTHSRFESIAVYTLAN
jgi:hypothetical protein